MSEPRGVTVKETCVSARETVDKFYSDEEIERLFFGDDQSFVNPLLRRAQAAEAIVDKLPETADHVRVVPGVDWVWRRMHMGHGVFEWVREHASDRKHLVEVCYSTQAAGKASDVAQNSR